ncbi:uncharacterized protein CIMG_12764 [Coccidioides immitis RS]|uniref:Uncharacterized protein n=1 Tax=Coccidioides immitis (strain RS) TaxID=246410 RepID=A0A0D8JSN3_COCIM|nr:uncharacterized protein CIMG_12764 [Coccidioides immitis RS]KJF60124.1 hypothetical protein CIMG_12764 [Coccidioides immitis RS]
MLPSWLDLAKSELQGLSRAFKKKHERGQPTLISLHLKCGERIEPTVNHACFCCVGQQAWMEVLYMPTSSTEYLAVYPPTWAHILKTG